MVARIDWTAAATAAGAGLAVIVPGAVLSGLIVDRAGSWVVWLFLAVVVAGFGLVGLVAGRLRTDTPMLHGAAGALIAFVVAAAIGLALAAVRDRSISIIAVPLAALTAVTAGIAGSLLADVLHRRNRRRAPAGS
ncbi:MAG: hypothetical protein AAFO29_03835 [Actinomycetota bacterium]